MKSLRRSLSAALAVAAVVALAPAAASAGDSYLALKGGVWVPTASDGWAELSTSGSQLAQGQFPASGDIELAYGSKFGLIGAQIAGGYMWSTYTDPTTGGKITNNAVPLYAVGQLRLPIFFIQPYLELGIGALANFANVSGINGSLSATRWSFLAIGGAGVDFILGPILLGAEARYMYATQQAFDWGNMKLSGVNITANVGYIF